MVIVPSATPQFVGSVDATLVICGAVGEAKMIGLSDANEKQVASVFLIATLYVPAAKPLNVFDDCQLVPPSIEYSKVPPVAVITI